MNFALTRRPRWDMFRTLESEVDQFFNQWFGKSFSDLDEKHSFPKWNIYRNDGKLVVDALVGDIPKEKVNIELDKKERVLTIQGESNQNESVKNEEYFCREVSKRAFVRRIRVPDDIDIDSIQASQKDGILKIQFTYQEQEDNSCCEKVEIN